MGSIGIQTDLEGLKGPCPFLFICLIKNEDAATQCYLPYTSEASTSTLLESNVETCNTEYWRTEEERVYETTTACKAEPPKKRGRPKKQKIEANVKQENNSNEVCEAIPLSRTRRERKIPIKFDPSDIEMTRETSHLIQANSNTKETFDEMDIDLKFEDTDEEDIQESKVSPTDTSTLSEGIKMDSVTSADETELNIRKCQGDVIKNLNYVKARRKNKCPYICNHCGQIFKIQYIYARHLRIHDTVKDLNSYPCRVCGKLLSSNVNLRRHMMIHSGKPFMCNKCGKTFTAHYLLKEHLVTEHNEMVRNNQTPTDYQCEACLKYMSSRAALEYHQAVAHGCPQCKTTWPCKKSLRDHLLEIHDEAKVSEDGHLICDQCNRTFVYRNQYLNHMAQHSSEKQHECPKCNKFFSTTQALYCHNKQVHEKHNFRHPCSMCEKVFICRAKLIEHTRTHTGERPFVCSECNVAFAAKATYKTHMSLIHKLPNPTRKTQNSDQQYKYNCPLCDEVDLKSSQLESHIQKVHNATVQFSNSIPANVTDQNVVIIDGNKDIVLVQGEEQSPLSEESKEIVLSEGTSEVIVLNGGSQKMLPKKEFSEIMVTEDNI